MAQQLSVFLENAPGRLSRLARFLGDKDINMHALFVADTSDYGVARVICDKTDEAVAALREAGFSVTITEVVAVEIPDRPGALADLLDAIAAENIDISYSYCFVEPATKNAVNVFRLKDKTAAERIAAAGFRVLSDADLHA
ncbi:MAG: amino acid-binding protein [Actinomycetes bacterium]|jgi:hypothetical protein|nr:amino acid-binding protein [Actinomycetes bacterium]